MNKRQICFSILMLAILLSSVLSLAETQTGVCGDNLTWSLDNNGTLTITGTGPMYNGENETSLFPTDTVTIAIISNGVTTIGDNAFRQCSELLSVTIPSSVTSIGSNAFRQCKKLIRANLPPNLTYLGSEAFRTCTALKSVTIPSTLSTLNERVFQRCDSLESVIVPGSITTVGDYAFSGCYGLSEVTINNGVTYIGERAFWEDTSLTSISIPGSVTVIGKEAFLSCSGLTEVNFSQGLLVISNYAFQNCSLVTEWNIPNTVSTIGTGAFWSLIESYRNITYRIPASVTSIGTGIIADSSEWAAQRRVLADCGSYAHQWVNLSTTTYRAWTGGNYPNNGRFEDRKPTFNSTHHVEKRTVTQAPTCSQTGLANTVCEVCGAEVLMGEIVPMVDHLPVSDQNGIEANCVHAGMTDSYSCLYCGLVMVEQEEIPMTNHTYVLDAAVEPTCTEDGLSDGFHCSVCGMVFQAQTVIPATGHTVVTDEAVEPTCHSVGWTEGSHCSVCGEVFVEQEEIAKLQHQSVMDPAVNPTCETEGHSVGFYCCLCGEVFVQPNIVPALGHEWGEITYTWAEDNSTVTAVRVCSRDETHVETETVAVTAEYTQQVTCTESGQANLTSAAFKNAAFAVQTKHETIPALGHLWNEPEYTWAVDYSNVTGIRICAHNSDHTETETVNATRVVTLSPTKTKAGRYSAISDEFVNGAFEVQEKQIGSIPALNSLKVLYLPAGLSTVADESFMGADCQAVIIPDGCTSIGKDAFANCTRLIYVRVPESVTMIDPEAFDEFSLVALDYDNPGK